MNRLPPTLLVTLSVTLPLALILGPAAPASGQLLSLRTIPLAAGNQFSISPMQRGGMAGVTIAMQDRYLDPFLNPSLGKNLEGSLIAGSPVFYGFDVSERGARSLPLTGLFKGDRWFGGATVALQQLLHEAQFGAQFIDVCCFTQPTPNLLRDRSSTNLYAQGFLGSALADGRWSWGVGAELAHLNAVDGVEILYAGSEQIEQSGSTVTLRGGLSGSLNGTDELELTAAFRQFRMTHDVTYVDWIWNGVGPGGFQEPVRRREENLDRTNTWGVDSKYARPITGTDWKVGGMVTVNYKDHPKIPNYQIQNIPRDPGNSWVYNVGLGMSRETETTLFGFDVILEPAWSHTWADAAEAVRRFDGSLIAPGEKTIENDFSFLNSKLRMGFEQRYEAVALQLGVGVTSVEYDLTQLDRVALTLRDQSEGWIEWTPSWGLTLQLSDARIQYAGWALLGAGAPGVARGGFLEGDLAAATTVPDFLLAPSGPLTLQDARVTTHQFTVSMPLR